MKTYFFFCIFCYGLWLSVSATNTYRLTESDLEYMSAAIGKPHVNKSAGGEPLSVNGIVYKLGVGTDGNSTLMLQHDGSKGYFKADVAVDDNALPMTRIRFLVFTENGPAFDSGVMQRGDSPIAVRVDLTGIKYVWLKTVRAFILNDYGNVVDYANWLNARFEIRGSAPLPRKKEKESCYLLTPSESDHPRINGPRIYGARPGNPFLYRIPVTGKRPLHIRASDLPAGLSLEENTGIISGITPNKGRYDVALSVENKSGKAEAVFTIVSGDTLSLTPYMGWSSWNTFGDSVSDQRIREITDAVVHTGLADYGYQYINIDDCWNVKAYSDDPKRGGAARDDEECMRSNGYFSDMKDLADYVHRFGLKLGVYSSPGPRGCGGYEGSFGFEKKDAACFADRGIDFLKYDMCSYDKIYEDKLSIYSDQMIPPFRIMGNYLAEQKRDILYNIVQYGMRNVWEWGIETKAHSWRISRDIGAVEDADKNLWESVSAILFNQKGMEQYAGPGHWNDPDYLLSGSYRRDNIGELQQTPLSYSEQYSVISMMALSANPIILSFDIRDPDAFTKQLICNADLLEIHQDRDGKQATCIKQDALIEYYLKPLSDGSVALGIFNLRPIQSNVCLDLTELLPFETNEVRDVWRQKTLSEKEIMSGISIPSHGCIVLRIRFH